MTWWWLSFCDDTRPKGSQFLGVAIVEAPTFMLAVELAHLMRCNPGGQVLGAAIEAPDPEFCYRVMDRAEADRLTWHSVH